MLNNANIVEAAANDAVGELTALEELLSGETIDLEKLGKVRDALNNADRAFFVVEASLYYTDPESETELASLPMKLATDVPGLKRPGFEELKDMLTSRISGETIISDAELRSAAKLLRQDLEILASAWSSETPGNFRNNTFLPDPDSIRRICQGLATTTDILVQSSHESENRQILYRLWAIKNILDGTYERFNGTRTLAGKGILDLVYLKDAAQAKSLQIDIDSAIRACEDPSFSRVEVLSAFQQLHYSTLSLSDTLSGERKFTEP